MNKPSECLRALVEGRINFVVTTIRHLRADGAARR
jgi:hypothetical protein